MDGSRIQLNTSALFRTADYVSPLLEGLHRAEFVLGQSAVPIIVPPSTPAVGAGAAPAPAAAAGVGAGAGPHIVADATREVGDEPDGEAVWGDVKLLTQALAALTDSDALAAIGLLPAGNDTAHMAPVPMAADAFTADAVRRLQMAGIPGSPFTALAHRRVAIVRDFAPILSFCLHRLSPAGAAGSGAGEGGGSTTVAAARAASVSTAPVRPHPRAPAPTFVVVDADDSCLAAVPPKLRGVVRFLDVRGLLEELEELESQLDVVSQLARGGMLADAVGVITDAGAALWECADAATACSWHAPTCAPGAVYTVGATFAPGVLHPIFCHGDGDAPPGTGVLTGRIAPLAAATARASSAASSHPPSDAVARSGYWCVQASCIVRRCTARRHPATP